MTAKVTILRAIRTATNKTRGFVSSAVLRPAGRPSTLQERPRLVWVVHIVTEASSGPGEPGKGVNIAVDAESNEIVPMPRPFGGPGGPGGFGGPGGPGGRRGGPPPGGGFGGGG